MSILQKLRTEISVCGATTPDGKERKVALTTILGELERSKGIVEINDDLLISTINGLRKGIQKSIKDMTAKKIEFNKNAFDMILAIYEEFVPEPKKLNDADTRTLIESIIADGANNIGMIMGGIRKSGKIVDNGLAAQIARELCD